jgi:hypothetical protein
VIFVTAPVLPKQSGSGFIESYGFAEPRVANRAGIFPAIPQGKNRSADFQSALRRIWKSAIRQTGSLRYG